MGKIIALMFTVILLVGCTNGTHVIDRMKANGCDLERYRESQDMVVVDCQPTTSDQDRSTMRR